jgi:sulfate permease, SulP family
MTLMSRHLHADRVQARVREAAAREGTKAVIIDAETVPFIDVSAVNTLDQLTEELEAQHVQLLLARDVGQVRDVLRGADAAEELRRVYSTVRAAIEATRASRSVDSET